MRTLMDARARWLNRGSNRNERGQERRGTNGTPHQAFGDSLRIDPYRTTLPGSGEPGIKGVASKGVGEPMIDIDSALRSRTDLSTILDHQTTTSVR